MRTFWLALLSLGAAVSRANAQDGKTPPWAASLSAGAVDVSDSVSRRALGGMLLYRATDWLTLAAAPTLVSASTGTTTATGLGDLPLSLVATKQFPGGLSPTLAAAAVITLPTGNAACGLGNGQTVAGLDVGAGLSPGPRVRLSVDATRSFSGSMTLSSLDQPQATWLGIDANVAAVPRWTIDASLGGDVGGVDTTAARREVGAGISYAVRGPLTLSVDVAHGLAGNAPRWGVVVSLGTAPAGLSPLNSTSPLERQRQVFAGGRTLKSKSTCP